MAQADLLDIYKSVLRPSAKYSSVIYHSLIPDYISNKLESVQRQALKIIFGWDTNLDQLYDNGTIETLANRREKNALSFALKAAASPRFGPSWFSETASDMRTARPTTRKKYKEKFCRTERGRRNPLNYFTRILNEHDQKVVVGT